MIYPTQSDAERAPVPDWYDEVIDLTLDEARGLAEMGVTVYMDDCHPGCLPWDEVPFTFRVNRASDITRFQNTTSIYYLPKESEHDTSQ